MAGDRSKPSVAPKLEPLLDVADVARIFKTSEKSVRRMITRGELPALRIGKLVRVHPKHVNKMMRVEED
jgi:excisionase family DNA binding protein